MQRAERVESDRVEAVRNGLAARCTVKCGEKVSRQQGSGWSVADADLGLIDEVLASLDIADMAFRELSELRIGWSLSTCASSRSTATANR